MKIKKIAYAILMPGMRLYWKIFKPRSYGVKVAIMHPANPEKLLLVRHSYGNTTLWNIPGGGYNPKKETAQNAAAREVLEELGVDVLGLLQIGE
jgi:ADP-ribose pyrophosphatase YjhB (NUDIX family)